MPEISCGVLSVPLTLFTLYHSPKDLKAGAKRDLRNQKALQPMRLLGFYVPKAEIECMAASNPVFSSKNSFIFFAAVML